MEYLSLFKNKLTTEEQQYIELGASEHKIFIDYLKEAYTNNVFNEHYMFESTPGYMKTTLANELAKKLNVPLIKFNGGLGLFAFAADLATVLLKAPKDDSKIYCLFDDCDSLFDKTNLNHTKSIFDEKRQCLSYNLSLGAQYYQLDDIQKEAIDAFRTPGKSGFEIPTDRFVFITLTNKKFPTQNDILKATDSKKQYMVDLMAVRRRNRYVPIDFKKNVDWGFAVHTIMTRDFCEKVYPDITFEQKLEIIKFTSPMQNWGKINERNMSTFDKMTKDMVKYPNNYIDRWYSTYIEKN